MRYKPKQQSYAGTVQTGRTSFGQAIFLWFKLPGINPEKPL